MGGRLACHLARKSEVGMARVYMMTTSAAGNDSLLLRDRESRGKNKNVRRKSVKYRSIPTFPVRFPSRTRIHSYAGTNAILSASFRESFTLAQHTNIEEISSSRDCHCLVARVNFSHIFFPPILSIYNFTVTAYIFTSYNAQKE